ncbi:hypothetical protein ARAM_005226 [Aspergillus rambellii]|uniref:Brix domain-containing protein n=1 Tax=Aspergillus rambellii TaxID=308745 RepID=A0A0F8WW59_9EURO|nr:hypothetical protein ARAM_005226 [Aspergillus rambellii]
MAVKKSLAQGPSSLSLDFKPRNKLKRQMLHVKRKRAKDSAHRARRFGIKKDEAKNPKLKEERLRKNIPLTLERKRVWDDADSDVEDALGVSVDVERIKRQKQEEEEELNRPLDSDSDASEVENDDDDDDDADSMLASSDDEDEKDKEDADNNRARGRKPSSIPSATERATSPSQSTRSTNLNLAPEALAAKFPSLFSPESHARPSVYIRRSAHAHSHKFSIREIAGFASNRNYTTLVILQEDSKKPAGLDIVHLPKGPMFHFSISNWVEGKKIPGHGNPTEHWPELILNNFRTPLGLLTAHLFRTLFPPQPDIQGRQVVTLHNQRDYIFVRRHRYVFREKRETEKSVVGTDGKEIKGAEWIRTGLQELGPRFTLKLRRVDKGIQRASGQEWEWKGGMEKQRTKFQL